MALRQTVNSVAELEARVSALTGEITRLEERRRPLILSSASSGWFVCTGCMEPKLTCLDTATWLEDFSPGNIVVGATIRFVGSASWDDAPNIEWVSHRVVAIREMGGDYYFWQQGYANDEPDGCWVCHAAVGGFVIAMHKNAVMANSTLRDGVSAARADYIAARDAYRAALDIYVGLRERYGCPHELAVTHALCPERPTMRSNGHSGLPTARSLAWYGQATATTVGMRTSRLRCTRGTFPASARSLLSFRHCGDASVDGAMGCWS